MFKQKLLRLRERTGCPYWAIKQCLLLTQGDENKAFEKLVGLYSVMGDHPEIVIKRNEEELRKEVTL